MFVATLTVPAMDRRVGRARSATAALPTQPNRFALAAVLGWLTAGGLAMALLPHSQVSADLGATLPFWLVGAPLIDLAWLMRRRAASALARGLCVLRPRQRRGARRLVVSRPAMVAVGQARSR